MENSTNPISVNMSSSNTTPQSPEPTSSSYPMMTVTPSTNGAAQPVAPTPTAPPPSITTITTTAQVSAPPPSSPQQAPAKPRIVKTVRFDLTFEQDNDDPSKAGIAEIRQVVVNDGDSTPEGTIQFFNPLNLLQQHQQQQVVRESEPNSKKWTHGGVVVLMGAIAVAIMVMFYAKTNGDSSNDNKKGSLDARTGLNDSGLFNSDIKARINIGQDGYLRMRPSLEGRAIPPRSNKGVNHMIQELLYIWTTYEHQDDAVDCPSIMMPRADHPCRFEMPLVGESCRPENAFGYLDYKPCIFLDLVQTGEWIPGPYYKGYSSEHETPLWAPVNCYLWVRSKEGAALQQGYLSSIWPSFGFPRWFFPASASTNFYSPMVAIQLDLADLPPNSNFVTLMCQVMASNGRLLAADTTWATISVAEIVKEQINKKAIEQRKREEAAAKAGNASLSDSSASGESGLGRGLGLKSLASQKTGLNRKFSNS
ncbi:unnamed protein product [Notodromas monacha]|uniref:Uncharacterized protein n=1 Tax=Notodromas monacha TaxID=399045 RepID=A0A7R9GF06_9CRUS|nr:unnamed protein product [Notodromas monacha]CAG0920186.1 unnamed protein product [Notodromas monacha]